MRRPVLFTTTDFPFYQFNGKWYYSKDMKRIGPFNSRDEANTAYRNDILIVNGVR